MELVASSVFSMLDDAFSFFFQVIFTLCVLTSHGSNASWGAS